MNQTMLMPPQSDVCVKMVRRQDGTYTVTRAVVLHVTPLASVVGFKKKKAGLMVVLHCGSIV